MINNCEVKQISTILVGYDHLNMYNKYKNVFLFNRNYTWTFAGLFVLRARTHNKLTISRGRLSQTAPLSDHLYRCVFRLHTCAARYRFHLSILHKINIRTVNEMIKMCFVQARLTDIDDTAHRMTSRSYQLRHDKTKVMRRRSSFSHYSHTIHRNIA